MVYLILSAAEFRPESPPLISPSYTLQPGAGRGLIVYLLRRSLWGSAAERISVNRFYPRLRPCANALLGIIDFPHAALDI